MPVRLVLSVILLSYTFSVAGQKNFVDGYIVKKNRDSLPVKIDYRDWEVSPAHVTYLDGSTGKPVEAGAEGLLAFGVNGDRYECHTVQVSPYSPTPEKLTTEAEIGSPYDTTVFLQVITTGKITLWEYRQAVDLSYYFINGKDGKPVQLLLITRIYQQDGGSRFEQQPYFRNQLSYRLRDCDAVQKELANVRYSRSSLEKLIFSYNHCGSDTTLSLSRGNNGYVRFFPVIGFMSSKVRFRGNGSISGPGAYETTQDFPAAASPAAGAGLIWLTPRNREKISFVGDILWQQFKSVSDGGAGQATGHIDYQFLKLDVLFRYRYPVGKVRVFAEGGESNSLVFGMNSYQYYPAGNGIAASTQPFLSGDTRHYMIGGVLGAGVTAGRWSVEGRYEPSFGISDITVVRSPTKSWYLLVSMNL